jgi:hypothetical protein
MRAWPTTPRQRGTGRACSGSHRAPPDAPRNSPPIERPLRSTSGRCGSLPRPTCASERPLGPTRELAKAYANLASERLFGGDNDAAISLARRAAAIVEPLGDTETLSDALDT